MLEAQISYTETGHHDIRIPSRDDFHKYAMNILSDSDFCTEYPTGHVIDAITSSLRWTKSNAKRKNFKGWRLNNANK